MQCDIRYFEDLFINAFSPIQTILYDGWLLQLSHGHTYRGNSLYALSTSTIVLREKLKFCERVYRENHLKPAFRIISSNEYDALNSELNSRGYDMKNCTNVMTIKPYRSEVDSSYEISYNDTISEEWVSSYLRLNESYSNTKEEYHEQLKRTVPHRLFVTLLEQKNHSMRYASI